jgi:N-acetylmuramic acid 6-phosphate etherase
MSNTESQDLRFVDIDTWPIVAAVEAMLEGQMAAIAAIKTQTLAIATAAEAAAERLSTGGRLVYVGAGTSGRVAVQDGVELGPTFGWPTDRLVYLMAGGNGALMRSVEGAEDDADAARAAISANTIGANDVVIGVAASGRTRFTIAAVEAAKEAGALTIAIANNPGTALLAAAQFAILADTGAEVIAGSTRMQAGTAQKAILNMLSTAIMLRMGRVYRGLMVDMVISNEKLRARAENMVQSVANCGAKEAKSALKMANDDIKTAILIAHGQSLRDATALLVAKRGILRDAIEA